jgi:hypothetical protein
MTTIREDQEDPTFSHDAVEGWEDEDPTLEDDWSASSEEAMALDPAVQVAGEEYEGIPESIRESHRQIPATVKEEVRRAHHALGHVARQAKKSEHHLFYIGHWICPVCLRRARPQAIPPVTGREKAKEFNPIVRVDLMEVLDCESTRHIFFNILDITTRYSIITLVPTKESSIVAQAFMESWERPVGTPDR